MLIKDVKSVFMKELGSLYPTEEINSFFYILLEFYTSYKRIDLALIPELQFNKKEESEIFLALSRLNTQEPIQHITGHSFFMDLELKVSPSVLIPRPETEELVDWIIKDMDKEAQNVAILDIGTGSGCIAIALAKEYGKAQVSAWDVSDKALVIARENATKNNVKIDFSKKNILTTYKINALFDVIVSNPPYVRELEKKEIQKNVKEFEPALALFVTDHKPLLFYERIGEFAQRHLKEKGVLYFEINQYLGVETMDFIKNSRI